MSYFPLIVGGAVTRRGTVWLEHVWSMLKYKVAPKVMCILHYVLKFSASNETVPSFGQFIHLSHINHREEDQDPLSELLQLDFSTGYRSK